MSDDTSATALRLAEAAAKSASLILAKQRASGAINGHCASRRFESTLALHLLRNIGSLPEHQRTLESYLDVATTFGEVGTSSVAEKAIAVMAERVRSGDSTTGQELVAMLPLREEGRKALYFGCLMAEVGVLDFADLPFDAATFDSLPSPVQSWAQVMLTSLKVMYCHGVARPDLVTGDERRFLRDKLLAQDVFENNVLTQIVGLLALSKLVDADELQRPASALMRSQQPDGGMPLMTGLDHFVTPLAAIALLDTVDVLPTNDRQTTVAAVEQMAEFIASVQVGTGGWSFMTGTSQTDMDDTGLCCALLARVGGDRFETYLQRGHRYLSSTQNDDGGFPTYIKGNPSTASMTAAALHGMAEVLIDQPSRSAEWMPLIEQSTRFLVGAQRDDGTFERRWSNAETHAMFRVAVALRLAKKVLAAPDLLGPLDEALARMQTYLVEAQNPDGGWGQSPGEASDISSTAYAVLASSPSPSNAAHAGITFILDRQQADGGFEAIPDLLGPRPVPYDIPILPTVTATHALGYYAAELA